MNRQIIRFKHFANVSLHRANEHWIKFRYNYILLLLAGVLVYTKDINLVLQLGNKNPIYEHAERSKSDAAGTNPESLSQIIGKDGEVHLVSSKRETSKEKRYKDYIRNHYKYALSEMHQHQIPASVTLAQGLLETDGGKSTLATLHNNHFGIKCFSKSCKKGHCANFNDDFHKDFFRKYKSTKESYCEHSDFLKKNRYKHLFSFGKLDYKAWCHGLKKAGYATDPKYAEKLITIIQKYELYKLDKM